MMEVDQYYYHVDWCITDEIKDGKHVKDFFFNHHETLDL